MIPEFTTLDGTPVSAFSFGTMQWGGKADAADSRRMYDDCRAAGINFFDTAWGYTDGASERLLGEFVAPERAGVFVATKVCSDGDCRPGTVLSHFEESLSRLALDQVDLLYLHRWSDEVPLQATYEALARVVETGRVRHIGVSNYAAWQVMKAQEVAHRFSLRIGFLQPMYSLVKRQVEVELLPMADDQGIAVVPYSPLGGGLLTGKYGRGDSGRLVDDAMYTARYAEDWMHGAAQALGDIAEDLGVSPITLAVAWVACNPRVMGPILSASRADQLAPSLEGMRFKMDDALYARLSGIAPAPPPATDRLEEG